ncbi:1-acylglycerol-3-phosphate O-acyltransferase [Pasteurella skyensis]|uniref:1-acyl-sn-glycerol-3-phosphate acyltransferase n=1 Tax=Phocoenobacter skyensis TaxID=97481 RepID=A0AAJ6P138_9PAST|nr:1-acylglycerol-3-phosphate O-acyltransferase [Pasteurella skyensis]MDP8162767.1 1-acylglycerol-3-phosphate O-acyltransferase [Pasteurella skyensis]MDP8173238.1 1-acylglycerol-3-phosphate O-acyltransferase [Pasteurella skyensis]MDP8177545.1 1-acylglycerol-3-phosphate O-acyltransferase [Pasteurella skyensis]MDP8178869.1 1-acylglycerol-3-phosphate O-acyltransferase [Pasteurella skyensis]MDP8183169.1 1-acylglycerol-3-phosphate O-acyltransferase [Pasteurella skyensis]
MLKILRIILVTFLAMGICIIGSIYSLFHFKDPSNVYFVTQKFAWLHQFLGIKLIRRPKDNFTQNAIYVANHQNNYDMVTIASMVQPKTVSIGKKSLVWIPFFGLVYWSTGNILIHRENRKSAINTMNKVADIIKKDNISIWMFPEGTRSRGRGLLPFKKGAFHTAVAAGVPIVPVVCSNLHNKIDLNRKNNGYVICETLEPIDTTTYTRENIKELIQLCHDRMEEKIKELNQEVAELEAKA